MQRIRFLKMKIENENLGAVNIVICNAAILNLGHVLEFSNDQLQKAVDVNIIGTINVG